MVQHSAGGVPDGSPLPPHTQATANDNVAIVIRGAAFAIGGQHSPVMEVCCVSVTCVMLCMSGGLCMPHGHIYVCVSGHRVVHMSHASGG